MKIFKKLAMLCLAGVMALGAVTLSGCGCSSIDRSDVATFFPFRPNTLFVYEYFIDGEPRPNFNQVMFFDHIDDNVAQRTIIAGTEETGINAYVETIAIIDNTVVNGFIGTGINRNNYLQESIINPVVMLDGPLRVGATWRAQLGGGGMVTNVVSLSTRVRVPYGTFRALEIRTNERLGANTSEIDFYAPGVGLVKRVTLIGRADGTIERHELMLVDVIENAGLEEAMAVFFPNNGELEMTYTVVAHYTNTNAAETYLVAANQVWREFGFEIDPAWLIRVDEILDGDIDVIFPQFDFTEQFVEAMNQLPDEETEQLVLWSIAATLSGVFNSSPRRNVTLQYNPNEAFITVNGSDYISNRIQMPLGERFIIFEIPEDEILVESDY